MVEKSAKHKDTFITLGMGLGSHSTPGERLNPSPRNVYKRGGVWVGAFILGGWVPQNPSDPPPPSYKRCLVYITNTRAP